MKKFGKIGILFLCAVLAASSCAPASSSASGTGREERERVIVEAPRETEPVITPSAPPGIYTPETRPERVTLISDTPYRIVITTTTAEEPNASSREADGEIRLPYFDTGDGASECAIVRAALYDGKERVGQTYTFTYFSAPEGRFTTPVFSLVSDPVGLYSDETGILVEGQMRKDALRYGNPKGWVLGNTNANFYGSGIEWERAMSMEFSESGSGAYDYSSNGGMRVNGGWTRANTQKSLKLFSRKSYTPDHGTFTLDLYPGYRDPATGRTLSFANTILLRGGSNNEGNNVIATPVQLKICEGTGQIIPAIRPVTEFINGKYRGVFMMIEDYDADFIEAHFGVPEEELTILSGSYENYGGSMWTLDTGNESDVKDFIRLMNRIAAADAKGGEALALAEEHLDLRNFIEYMCIELYCGNSDWPDNNLRCFRRNADGFQPDAEGIYDGRYRFLLKDLDISFGTGHSVSKDPYHTIGGESALLIRNVFNRLMKNETFRNRVYTYFCTLATAVFDPARVSRVIGEISLSMLEEMEYTTKSLRIAGGSTGSWRTNVSGLRSYAVRRVKTVLEATERESGKKLSSLAVSLEGEGTAELGWFPASDGETRQYLKSTVIPLTVPEGAEVEVDGGMFNNGNLILTADSAALRIRFPEPEPVKTASSVVINEIAVRNAQRPFIELYNPTGEDVKLDGWTLGTKKSQSLDGLTVPAHGFLTFGEGYDAPISFGLGKENTLTLAKDGEEVDSFALGEIHPSVYRGRIPDGGESVTLYASELTPGAPNAVGAAFAMGVPLKDAIVICGVKTDLEVRLGENTLLPLSMFKSPFKFARDVYREQYDWIREHEEDKMTVSELIEFFRDTPVDARFYPEKNLFIVQ